MRASNKRNYSKQELTLLKEQLKMQELMSNGKKEDTDKSIFKD